MVNRLSRRVFSRGLLAGAACLARPVFAQLNGRDTPQSTARPNVAAIDHDRILRLAAVVLPRKPLAITAIPAPGSPVDPHIFFSTPDFSGHRDALREVCLRLVTLAAAYGLTREDRYAAAAAEQIHLWFVAPATRMLPHLRFARVLSEAVLAGRKSPFTGTPEGIIEGIWLAEFAVALPFLAASQALSEPDLAATKAWLAAYSLWLTEEEDSGPRIAALARDLHNHHGSSWLLQATATALASGGDAIVSACRHRFERVTLRAQVVATGIFPAEITGKNPYRDSLLNLDLLAGACHLLSTSFEDVWNYELQDGPGMRAVLAFFFKYIREPGTWPYPADSAHFADLPLRRPALLFGARAYTRPDYADLWKSLPPDPPEAPDHLIADSFPIRQPYLWVTRPPRRPLA